MLYASLMLKWKLDITDCDLKRETLGKGEPRVMGVSLQLSGCSQRNSPAIKFFLTTHVSVFLIHSPMFQ